MCGFHPGLCSLRPFSLRHEPLSLGLAQTSLITDAPIAGLRVLAVKHFAAAAY